jgi:hypothetical protein
MMMLYPEIKDSAEFKILHDRSKHLAWDVVIRAIELGNNIILDWGFWSRISRDEAREKLSAAGAIVKLYYLCCSDELMTQRVKERNKQLHDAHPFKIDEHTLAEFRQRFDPLGPDEDHIVIDSDQPPELLAKLMSTRSLGED